MIIKSFQLSSRLAQELPRIIWLSGDEPLLINQAKDEIISKCRSLGFNEHSRLSLNSSSASWNSLFSEFSTQSLFNDKKLVEVTMENLKFGQEGNKLVSDWLNLINDDVFVLILSGKLSKEILKLKWLKTIEAKAWLCQFWSIDIKQLPNWINNRAKQQGLIMQEGAAITLAQKVEGNLLAADQEIEKLKLQGKTNISAEFIYQNINDSSSYEVYQMIEAMLIGNSKKTIRIFRSLLAQGTALQIIIWVLAKTLRELIMLQQSGNSGSLPKPVEFVPPFIWQKQLPLLRQALKRAKQNKFSQMLQELLKIDCASKGYGDSPNERMEQLLLTIAQG